jgi:hypothetical protein
MLKKDLEEKCRKLTLAVAGLKGEAFTMGLALYDSDHRASIAEERLEAKTHELEELLLELENDFKQRRTR